MIQNNDTINTRFKLYIKQNMSLLWSYIMGSFLGWESLIWKMVLGWIANEILFGDEKRRRRRQVNNNHSNEQETHYKPKKSPKFSAQKARLTREEKEKIKNIKKDIKDYLSFNYKNGNEIVINTDYAQEDWLIDENENPESFANSLKEHFKKIEAFAPFKELFYLKNFEDYFELMGWPEWATTMLLKAMNALEWESTAPTYSLQIDYRSLDDMLIKQYENNPQLQEKYDMFILDEKESTKMWRKEDIQIHTEWQNNYDRSHTKWVNMSARLKNFKTVIFKNKETSEYINMQWAVVYGVTNKSINYIGKKVEKKCKRKYKHK